MRNQGFSLIELMVVVAILSLTAALLVPKFLKHRELGNPSGSAEVSKPTE